MHYVGRKRDSAYPQPRPRRLGSAHQRRFRAHHGFRRFDICLSLGPSAPGPLGHFPSPSWLRGQVALWLRLPLVPLSVPCCLLPVPFAQSLRKRCYAVNLGRISTKFNLFQLISTCPTRVFQPAKWENSGCSASFRSETFFHEKPPRCYGDDAHFHAAPSQSRRRAIAGLAATIDRVSS